MRHPVLRCRRVARPGIPIEMPVTYPRAMHVHTWVSVTVGMRSPKGN